MGLVHAGSEGDNFSLEIAEEGLGVLFWNIVRLWVEAEVSERSHYLIVLKFSQK